MQPKPILYIVDDDDDYLEMIQEDLEEQGIQCRGFLSGKDFFAALNTLHEYPTAILLDYVLTPRMSGKAVLQILQERQANLPVIVYTGQDRQGTVEAFSKGAYATLIKPVDPQELSLIIFEIFNQNEIFRKMAEDVLSITNFDSSMVWQLNKESYSYLIVGWSGIFDREYRYNVSFHHDTVEWIETLKSGTLYYCSNVLDNARYQKQEEAVKRNWRTLITIPLVRGDRVLGWIDCYSLEINYLNDISERKRLLHYLKKFAAQASETLRADALTRQLRMVHEITQKLTWAATEVELFNVILKKAQEYTGALSGRIYKFDVVKQNLVLGADVRSEQEKPAPQTKELGLGLTGQVAESGQYDYIKISPDHPEFSSNPIKSHIAVPIKRGEQQVLGVITMKSPYYNFFTPDDIQLLHSLAASAAVVIDQVKLSSHLQAISKMAQESDSEQNLIQYVVEAARDLTHADVNFWTMSERPGEGDNWMRIKAYSGKFLPGFLEDAKLPTIPNSSTNVKALHEKRTIIIEDLHHLKEGEVFNRAEAIEPHGWNSFMAVPLLSKSGDHLGVLSLYSRELKAFSSEGSTLIEHFVSQTALAIQEQRHIISLQKLSQLGSDLSVGLPGTKALLNKVAELGRTISKADLTVLYPYDYNNKAFFDVDAIAISGKPKKEPPFIKDRPKPEGMAFLARTYRAVIVQDRAKLEDPIYIGLDGKKKPINALDHQTIVEGIESSTFIKNEQIQAFISVSLTAIEKEGGQESLEVGVMYFNYRAPKVFSEEELRIIEIFAHNTANIIYRNRLHDQTQRQRELMEAVNKAGVNILKEQNQKEQFEGIIQEAIHLLHASGGTIYLVINGSKQDAQLMAGINLPKGVKIGDTFSSNEGIVGQVIRSKRPKIVNDYPAYEHRIRRYAQYFSAVVEVPLLYQDEVIGVLSIFDDNQKRGFVKEDVQLLEALAAQASLAVYNLRLNKELETLYRAGLQLSVQLDIKQTATRVLVELKKLIQVDKATLQLIKSEFLLREILAFEGFPPEEINSFLLGPIDFDPLIKTVVQSKNTLILKDTHQYQAWSKNIRGSEDVRSWACIPLVYNDRVFAIITLDHRQAGFYQPRDEARLNRFGNQAAIAMQNALLFEENQKQKDIQGVVIQNITGSIVSLYEDEKLYKSVADAAMTLFSGAHRTEIYLHEGTHFRRVAMRSEGIYTAKDVRETFRLNYGLVGEVFKSGTAKLLKNVKESQTYKIMLLETASEIVMPIKQGDKVIGVLNIEHPVVGGLTEKDLVIADALANLTAIIREKGDLRESLRLMNRFLDSVREVSSLKKEKGKERTMAILAKYAYLVTNQKIDSCTFYTLDLELFSITEINNILRSEFQLPILVKKQKFSRGEGLPGLVAQNGEALLINDFSTSPFFDHKSGVKSLMITPFWSSGILTGAFAFESNTRNSFNDLEFEIFKGFVLLGESSFSRFEQESKKKQAIEKQFNPYVVGPPIINPQYFYGREKVISYIIQGVHNNHFFIYGERRIGKTSLLHQVKHYLTNLPKSEISYFPVYFDLQGVKESDFFVRLIRRIIHNLDLIDQVNLPNLKSNYDIINFEEDYQSIISFLKSKENILNKNFHIVVLIDEFQKINEFEYSILENLRRILQEESSLRLVMAGFQYIQEKNLHGASPFNLHITNILSGLEEADAKRLILEPVQGIYNYAEEVIDKIITHSKLKPIAIQGICYESVNQMLSRTAKSKNPELVITLKDFELGLGLFQKHYPELNS